MTLSLHARRRSDTIGRKAWAGRPGAGYTGGFLDGFNPSDRDVTITFDTALAAFGFDLGGLGAASFDVTIHFASDPDQNFNNAYPAGKQFFGWQSNAADITSVTVSNNGGFFGFDFDNFTFGGQRDVNDVSAPGTLALLLLGLAVGAGAQRRARK